ncbi:phosphoribosylformylglycinamidine cyclo-ligase [Candidatus Uhrbacteria bacterium]|nr:phosphoribosylformylglycinamidine cyclo-ligase [Candidatus Uhrbacteria bacterium]
MTTDAESAYAKAGVNYKGIDAFKRNCQAKGRLTDDNARRRGLEPMEWSRGETAAVKRLPDGTYLATVNEGVGTKPVATGDFYKLTGWSRYKEIAQDTAAAIFNDLVAVGAQPSGTMMHLAVGSSAFFDDEPRLNALIEGWFEACQTAGCRWDGGETSVLVDNVESPTFMLSGSAEGLIRNPRRLIKPAIEDGDAIVVLPSTGIHVNGLTAARKLADALPDGYRAKIDDGREFGAALLDATPLYGPLIENLQEAAVRIHYAVPVTGHGWRKLMRAQLDFSYVIEKLPPVPPVLQFMQRVQRLTDAEAYSTYNMGAGFVLFVPPSDVGIIRNVAALQGMTAMLAGRCVSSPGGKSLTILPLNVTYQGDSLDIR